MPYIPPSERLKVDELMFVSAGSLNYALHQMIDQYFKQHKINYQTINDVVGVLECAKQEIYRRIAGDYEDRKILQNGDCEPYASYNNPQDE